MNDYCYACGAKVKKHERFCHNCGAMISKSTPSNVLIEPKKRKINFTRKSKIICIILTLLILIPLVSSIIYHSKYTVIDMSDYIGVSFSGRNGNGQAEIFFIPEDELFAKLRNKSRNVVKKYGDYVDVAKFISLSIDKNSGLTNGDKVVVSLVFAGRCNEYDFKTMGIVFKNTERKFTVSGLEDNIEIDLRDYSLIRFSGHNGNGYADFYLLDAEGLYRAFWNAAGIDVPNDDSVFDDERYVNDYGGTTASDLVAYFEPELSPRLNLSNGDKVIINLNKDFYEQYGIVFTQESLEYIVSGLE